MIYVVKHRPYDMPELPDGYRTICVGGYTEPGAIDCRDGENIERLNTKINELTAFYWLWKHTDDPIIGTAHYRRFLADDGILTMQRAEELLRDYDIICHDFGITARVRANVACSGVLGGEAAIGIVERHLPPEYEAAFDKVMNGNHYRICNLLATSREVFDAYCEWLFSFIIEAADEYRFRIGCGPQEKRAVGYVAEALLSVWLEKNELRIADREMVLV